MNEHLQSMRTISPPESVHALNLDGLLQPEITFWTARDRGELLGCTASKTLNGAHGEVKSMRTPSQRRHCEDHREHRRGCGDREDLAHVDAQVLQPEVSMLPPSRAPPPLEIDDDRL
ncbi:MAG: hypothetical protein AAGI88_08765 [Pseudomonadota bacterium]